MEDNQKRSLPVIVIDGSDEDDTPSPAPTEPKRPKLAAENTPKPKPPEPSTSIVSMSHPKPSPGSSMLNGSNGHSSPHSALSFTRVSGQQDTSSRKQESKPAEQPKTGIPRPATEPQQDTSNDDDGPEEPEEIITKYVSLDEPKDIPLESRLALRSLTDEQGKELELALQLDADSEEGAWKSDWSGNLDLLFTDIPNPEAKRRNPGKSERMQPLHTWAVRSEYNNRIMRHFFVHVHNMKETPPSARRIIRWAYNANEKDKFCDVGDIVKRFSYDPNVLREDGWVTKKSKKFEGATGGAFHIGTKVMWEGWEAVVIAYVHDNDLGDLWKAMWLEDLDTFDLEAEELQRAQKKWNRKFNKQQQAEASKPSARFATVKNFTVPGIEHGIILASSYHPNARQGVFWPARVMHVSEIDKVLIKGKKRSSAKQKVNVVFLAPYWNGSSASRQGSGDSLSHAKTVFDSGPLLEMDSIDVSEETVQPYPYEGGRGLNIDQLRVAFRFTGLPKNAFARFLNSHRLALGLKTYAQKELKSRATSAELASAALTDTHQLSVQAARFPPALLHIPFAYILSHLPSPTEEPSPASQQGGGSIEKTIHLASMLKAMEPPSCWGERSEHAATPPPRHRNVSVLSPVSSPRPRPEMMGNSNFILRMEDVASDVLMVELNRYMNCAFPIAQLTTMLRGLVSRLGPEAQMAQTSNTIQRSTKLSTYLRDCLVAKFHGEDLIWSEISLLPATDRRVFLEEWRKACERLYKHISLRLSWPGLGNGITCVITDSRCNEHITSNGCVERPVRLPAALRGVREAAKDISGTIRIMETVQAPYVELTEKKVLAKAHSASYVTRMKLKCSMLSPEATGAPLTDDSDGEGGEDTMGSRGSFTAALVGVSGSIKAVDMIIGGQCVNAFCATRPPGHHAGRELHPMKTSSNGFCLLNTAACAALYATSSVTENGPGLRRVCVIDFDVHHGNGTQDILCSTYDPRFLYISIHAGGPDINGYDTDDSDNEYRSSIGSRRQEIFPGRCGDTSPHKGVLNIPLGAKLTPHAVGNAFVSSITPAVEEFSPDLIILSAGFDGHKNDPLNLGGLSAADYASITDVACSLAYRTCGGRLLSILEGGYGVPCCRPQKDLFLPSPSQQSVGEKGERRQQPSKLGMPDEDMPDSMDDQMPYAMQRRLERCHAEGFIDCVREHVKSLGNNNKRLL